MTVPDPEPDKSEPADETQMAEFNEWLKASNGLARGKGTTDEILRETRGDAQPDT